MASSSSLPRRKCHHISLDEIKDATDNFSEKNLIGKGGEGDVYMSEIRVDGIMTQVAVKRLSKPEFSEGFESEIKIVSKFQHPNLVSLLGYCDESGEKILLYEYMEKGSLSSYIKEKSSTSLPWQQRLRICLDAAHGLQHVHVETDDFPKGIIHRDVKPDNILLDKNWVAKISDFGLLKLSHVGQTQSTMVTGLKGTCRYFAPEYVMNRRITRAADVYAFGVVLFQVLCLTFPWDRGDESYYIIEEEDVAIWARQNVDSGIEGEISYESLMEFTAIVGESLKMDPRKRPTMDGVVLGLENALKFQLLHDEGDQLQGAKESDEVSPKSPRNRCDSSPVSSEEGQRRSQSVTARLMGLQALPSSSSPDPLKKPELRRSPLESRVWRDLFQSLSIVFFRRKSSESKAKDGVATRGAKGPTASEVAVGEAGRKLVHFDGSMVYTHHDLFDATAEVMGKDTYGTVYRAILEDGNQVAVKRLRGNITKNQREFETEVNVIGKIRHPNLLAMRAYYLGKGEELLVFDYMPKGSLATFLHARGPNTPINWPTRMNIAKGMSRGLFYLHSHQNIIHGNLTSRNVLLDKSSNAKIADYGLSRLMTDAANSNVIAIARGLGYRAPELSKLKKANTKTDVYSLGVIILELLTGKSPAKKTNHKDLPQWVALIVKGEWANEVFDFELMKEASTTGDELMNTLKLALHCVDPSPSARPEVQLVLQQLEEIRSETATTSGDEGGGGGGASPSASD